jgi:heme/copper-type cytochrome/quinol oxidase subunit 1
MKYPSVTGVILANASLDVALHDTYYVVYLISASSMIPLSPLRLKWF